jgi:hypothetical protein
MMDQITNDLVFVARYGPKRLVPPGSKAGAQKISRRVRSCERNNLSLQVAERLLRNVLGIALTILLAA